MRGLNRYGSIGSLVSLVLFFVLYRPNTLLINETENVLEISLYSIFFYLDTLLKVLFNFLLFRLGLILFFLLFVYYL